MLEKLARSRTAQARLVERAEIILAVAAGDRPSVIAERLHVTRLTVYSRSKRFNAGGLDGLHDQPRSGRPATYQPDEIAQVIATALSKPQDLQLEFASWTLDRLETYVNQQKGIAIKRSRIDELLIAEELRWRTQETWFGEKVAPDFAEKRGGSKRSTRPRQRAVS